MRYIQFAIQLLVAAFMASAAAGMLFLFLLMAGTAAGGGVDFVAGVLFAALFSFLLGGAAIIPAVTLMAVPAFLVGGALCLAGRRHARFRQRRTFALTGALVGGVAYALLTPAGTWGILDAEPRWAFMTFAISGACSALVFRSSVQLLGSFLENGIWEVDTHLRESGPL
jgi:hypothetical protein